MSIDKVPGFVIMSRLTGGFLIFCLSCNGSQPVPKPFEETRGNVLLADDRIIFQPHADPMFI